MVFDLDDTLYDERDYVRSGFAHVARSLAGPDVETRDVESWLNAAFDRGVRGDTFDRLVTVFPSIRAQAGVPVLVQRYRDHQPRISLASSTVEALDALAADGFLLGILSDGPEESQKAKIDALGLQRWFTVIILTSALGTERSKPSPVGFTLIAQRWGLAGHSLCYVGDNPGKDFIAPNELGWHSIRIRNPRQLRHGDEPANPAAAPDLEVGSLAEVRDHLAMAR